MKRSAALIVAGFACLTLAACDSAHRHSSDPQEHEHGPDEADHHDHEHEEGAVRFIEGKGLALPEESEKALGLTFSLAERHRLFSTVPVEAQVYRAATEPSRQGGETRGNAYAAAFLTSLAVQAIKPDDAATLTGVPGSFSGNVWKIDPASRDALANEEVILQIPDAAGSLKVGDFLSGVITKQDAGASVLSIPSPAVLETVAGRFAFVKNGGFLLRVPVRTGAVSADRIEITDGLRDGDTVVTHPVQTLYLIELRATKGGGHSH